MSMAKTRAKGSAHRMRRERLGTAEVGSGTLGAGYVASGFFGTIWERIFAWGAKQPKKRVR